ncbi:hypothetical protein [Antarctobacter heliothermus]|uniref:Uncharacterized protein n=1 Tax=Antarctobacter heliothermus TaxID=74033 RepID=A0A239H5V8_9RHOB|nr:hypothetical protein [Antarctobacter heliothermus]SNS76535.1 hypothetical protein SAMN04488078_103116 [Antarctobacter heliothermus]
MRRTILSGLLWTALCGAASAEMTAYQCAIRGTSGRQWIQPLIFIALDRATDRVVVSDASILGFNNGVPVEGTLVRDNAARVTVAWELELRSASNQTVRMDYRATYLKATGKVNVSARPQGYEDLFNRAGTCTVTKLSG